MFGFELPLLFLLAAIAAATNGNHAKKDAPNCSALPPKVGKRILKIAVCSTKDAKYMPEILNLSDPKVFRRGIWNITGNKLLQAGGNDFEMINICANIKWNGFLTKPATYLTYAQSLQKFAKEKGILDDDIAIMFVDSDTFWSTHSVASVFQKYDCIRKEKSLVMSTEISCWVGRYCTTADLDKYYRDRESPSYSSFINSGLVMGSPSALVHMLQYIIDNNKESYVMKGSGIKKFDDQHAFVVYESLHRNRVALDYHQELFGSLSLVVDLNHTKYPFVCESRAQREYKYHLSCDDITLNVAGRKAYSVDPATCELRRVASLEDANIPHGDMVNEFLRTVATDPVIWHGSGVGKRAMDFVFSRKIVECIRDKL
jgi:hypothetical protein